MKELSPFKKVEIHQEAEKKQEYKFMGSLKLKTGCILFSFNPDTNILTEVKIKKTSTVMYSGSPKNGLTSNTSENNTANFMSGYVYFQAINLKNAGRKLARYKAGDYSVVEKFETADEPMKLAY